MACTLPGRLRAIRGIRMMIWSVLKMDHTLLIASFMNI